MSVIELSLYLTLKVVGLICSILCFDFDSEHRRTIEYILAAIEPPAPSTTSFSRLLKGEEGDGGKEVMYNSSPMR